MSAAIDEVFEDEAEAMWAAMEHPLPCPPQSHSEIPSPTKPLVFAPGVIEHHERKNSAPLVFLVLLSWVLILSALAGYYWDRLPSLPFIHN